MMNKMRFKTLSDYDDEIKKCDRLIGRYKKYLKEHPADVVSHTNYKILKYVRSELKKQREDLEFHKSTQEALDRCDASKKGMSVEEFFKELDSW